MAVAEITASNFTLTSRWSSGGTPSEETKVLSFAYSLPAAAVINSTSFTLTTGNPNTGIYYVRANGVSMGNYFNTTYTKTITGPTATSGTFNVTVKYRANGNSGTGSGACAFTGIKLTINYTINSFAVTTTVSPAGGGTLSASPASAAPGATVTLTRTTASGYYFNGYTTSPSVSINSSGQFTMPSSAVTVTANYLKYSTCSLNTKNMTGGGSVVLTISADKTTYAHYYNLSFGTNMETGWVYVAPGTTSVTISVPAGWSNALTNAASKSGGTLSLVTYNGSTLIGTVTITGLTFNVPASAVPTVGAITTAILRTVGGVTYADVGEYYVQSHSGVSISSSATGVYSSTIASMSISISGYSGTGYAKTVAAASISLDSGLLTKAGSTTITVTATDSRGRSASATATITVTGYSKPIATLTVERTDSNGDPDPMGTNGGYEISYSFTSVGSNALQYVHLSSQGITVTPSANAGQLLPENVQTYSIQLEYEITFEVQDAFETTTVTAKLPTGRFVIFVSADGSKLGFMRATSGRAIPAGKSHLVEFSADSQIYIGDETFEAYIRRIANS